MQLTPDDAITMRDQRRYEKWAHLYNVYGFMAWHNCREKVGWPRGYLGDLTPLSALDTYVIGR